MHKKISKWTDGDSGRFLDGRFFRLANVRAPEHHQFGGEKALRSAAAMTSRAGQIVNVKTHGIDHYSQLLIDLSNKDGSINKRLQGKGYYNKGR